MYITKRVEQEIFFISQQSNDGAPPKHTHTHTQLPKLPEGARPYLSGLLDCT